MTVRTAKQNGNRTDEATFDNGVPVDGDTIDLRSYNVTNNVAGNPISFTIIDTVGGGSFIHAADHNSGTFTIGSGGKLSLAASQYLSNVVVNDGGTVLHGANSTYLRGDITVNSGGTWSQTGGALITIFAARTVTVNAGGSFVQAGGGTINTVTYSQDLNIVVVGAGILTLNGTITQNATSNVNLTLSTTCILTLCSATIDLSNCLAANILSGQTINGVAGSVSAGVQVGAFEPGAWR